MGYGYVAYNDVVLLDLAYPLLTWHYLVGQFGLRIHWIICWIGLGQINPLGQLGFRSARQSSETGSGGPDRRYPILSPHPNKAVARSLAKSWFITLSQTDFSSQAEPSRFFRFEPTIKKAEKSGDKKILKDLERSKKPQKTEKNILCTRNVFTKFLSDLKPESFVGGLFLSWFFAY